jgi:hypothetical protein
MAPNDNRETKATKYKIRIRVLNSGEFLAYNWFGHYASYGITMQDAHTRHCKLICSLN